MIEYIGINNQKITIDEETNIILNKKYITDNELSILDSKNNIKISDDYSIEKENGNNYEIYFITDLNDNIIETIYLKR